MLEICVEDAAGMAAARAGGADRLELCSALALGGLTPCASLVACAVAQDVPVHALARPRPGHFVYDAQEVAMVERDIDSFARAGLAGAVLGCGGPQGLDLGVLAGWVDKARDAAAGRSFSLTLHRVFDLLDDKTAGLEQAISLGFDRILTSGGALRAGDGLEVLAGLVRQARGRIAILAGGGLDPAAVQALRAVGVAEFHASCRVECPDPGDARLVALGFQDGPARRTDPARVRAFRAALA